MALKAGVRVPALIVRLVKFKAAANAGNSVPARKPKKVVAATRTLRTRRRKDLENLRK